MTTSPTGDLRPGTPRRPGYHTRLVYATGLYEVKAQLFLALHGADQSGTAMEETPQGTAG